MALFRLFAISAAALTVSACNTQTFSNFDDVSDIFRPTTAGTPVRVVKGSPNVYKPQKQEKMTRQNHTQPTMKRINTTQCHDSDDWYLDGYRVGRSFSSQKTAMLQQRMGYCQLAQLPSHFKANWERGFNIGNRQTTPKRKSRKS